MIYLLAFALAIVILVFFHELGHFLFARMAGVKVLTFSIGFGPKIWSFKDNRGTEYQLAAFPIGGYVRMLGEDEFAEQPELVDDAQAFKNAAPIWKVAIAAAGPFASLLLGFLIFYVILITGTRELDPYIGEVTEQSPAMVAGMKVGEKIRSVDGNKTGSWQDVNLALVDRLGDTGFIEIETAQSRYDIAISSWLSDQVEPDVLDAIGLGPEFRAHIREVAADSPAETAGFEVGDYISHIDGEPTGSWFDVVDIIRASANQPLTIKVERDGQVANLILVPRLIVAEDGTQYGQAGIMPEVGRSVRYGLIEAIPAAYERTIDLIVLSGESIYKMVVGDVHVGNLGGPIRIAQYAGDFAAMGIEPYLTLLAALTIALGLINLLPIPMLDGGHIVFGLVESITNKPIPYKVQMVLMRVGLFMVGTLMIFALLNDMMRLIG